MEEQSHYYNFIPQGFDIQDVLKNFGKQWELNFALESNKLASKCTYNKLPIRNLSKVDVFMRLADVFQLTKKLITHCQKKYYGEDYFKQKSATFEKLIYQREYHVETV